MAKPNLDKFLELAQRSGLVERDQLSRAMDQIEEKTGQRPTEPEPVGSALVSSGLITRWQCDKLLESRHKGFFIKRYKLLGHLGTGGMSSVYLAEHVLMQRRVAIKVLPKNRVGDSSYLERFHRESQAAASLDHRNIVRAYDVDNEGDLHFMVMEYVDGRDLQVMVREDGPLEYPAAADYIRQAALGLAHAHEAGLIHRDVKPANLLVDRNKVVKVLDLGLARFTGEERASLTVAYDENVLGTADYLAPEQALDSHGVDARADIYSLGCSFYFLLTGRPPFPDGTLPQRLMMHQKHPPPSIHQVRPDAPDDLVHICLKMIAKKPEDRFQSALEVADVLTDWLVIHGHAVGSASGGSSGRLKAAAAAPRQWVRAKKLETPDELRAAAQKGSSVIKRGSGLIKGGSSSGQGKRGSGSGLSKSGSGLKRAKPLGEGAPFAAQDGSTTGGSGISPSKSGVSPDKSRPVGPTSNRSAGGSGSKVGKPSNAEPVKVEPAEPAFLIQAGSPVVERLKSGRTMTREEYEASRRKRDEIPLWIWGVVAGGCVLAVVLLLLLLMSG